MFSVMVNNAYSTGRAIYTQYFKQGIQPGQKISFQTVGVESGDDYYGSKRGGRLPLPDLNLLRVITTTISGISNLFTPPPISLPAFNNPCPRL